MTDLERLWTPYRMAYVRSDTTADGCPFCQIPDGDDVASLVVARGETAYVVLNLHPYNPGHLMVLPYRHVAELEDLTPEESGELMAMTQRAIRVIREVSNPHAFNIGINLGSAGRRLAGGPPAPARRAALVRGRQLHRRHRRHQDPAAAARGHPRAARGRLARRTCVLADARPCAGPASGRELDIDRWCRRGATRR